MPEAMDFDDDPEATGEDEVVVEDASTSSEDDQATLKEHYEMVSCYKSAPSTRSSKRPAKSLEVDAPRPPKKPRTTVAKRVVKKVTATMTVLPMLSSRGL